MDKKAKKAAYMKEYHARNKERRRLRDIANKEQIDDTRRQYCKNNASKVSNYKRMWAKSNPEKVRDQDRRKRDKNRKNCTNYYIAGKLRTRMWFALRAQNASKLSKMSTVIGCSAEYLRTHLSSRFQDGMSWENYGEWHIDHIVPCAAFDLKYSEQQKKCFHYTNLQPLWKVQNLKKGKKV